MQTMRGVDNLRKDNVFSNVAKMTYCYRKGLVMTRDCQTITDNGLLMLFLSKSTSFIRPLDKLVEISKTELWTFYGQ